MREREKIVEAIEPRKRPGTISTGSLSFLASWETIAILMFMTKLARGSGTEEGRVDWRFSRRKRWSSSLSYGLAGGAYSCVQCLLYSAI